MLVNIRNVLYLFLVAGFGLVISVSPADMSNNVCDWLKGADLSCPIWMSTALSTTLAYLIVYGVIVCTILFLLLSLLALIRQSNQISQNYFPRPGDIMPKVARTWAETGTWTPMLLSSDRAFLGDVVKISDCRYWNFGGYAEISGALTVNLGKGASLVGASIVGLPFLPSEDATIKISCEKQEILGSIRKGYPAISLDELSKVLPSKKTLTLKFSTFYKTV